MENHRDENGNFQFKLCYPELDKCNEWIQSSNPATETEIKGFRAIDLKFKTTVKGGKWAGLGKSISGPTLMDDTPTTYNWYCAIGASSNYPSNPKIPGPAGYFVTEVDLYVFN